MSDYKKAIKRLIRNKEELDALKLEDKQLCEIEEAYTKCMNEICKEINKIKEIRNNKSENNQLNIMQDSALSMRRIIENVGFALMTAQTKEFVKRYGDISSDWNFKKIISKLKSLNLNYKMKHKVMRPVVHAEISSKGVERHSKNIDGIGIEVYFDDPQVEVTIDDLEKQYNFYSKYIHAQNPFNLEQLNLNRFLQRLDRDIDELKNFLNAHIIYIYEDSGLAISCKFKTSENMNTTAEVKLIILRRDFNNFLCEIDQNIEGQ